MTRLNLSRMGFGITGALDHDIVRELAPRLESAGFRTLWVNHAGGGDALASMAVAASVTSSLRLASGVIPVDKVNATEIARSFHRHDLPRDRVIIGIGASAPPSPLTTVEQAASALSEDPGVPVMVGALGPKMRRLGVRKTHGVLLNWLTPEAARQAMEEKDRDLGVAHNGDAEVALYIRCALGKDALPVLEREASRYEEIPSYSANFSRLGFAAMDSAVHAVTREEFRLGLAPFTHVVDEPVLRAITANDVLDEYIALVDAASGA